MMQQAPPLRQHRRRTLRRLPSYSWQQWSATTHPPAPPGHHAPGKVTTSASCSVLGCSPWATPPRTPRAKEPQRQLHEAGPGLRAPAGSARLAPAQRRTYQHHQQAVTRAVPAKVALQVRCRFRSTLTKQIFPWMKESRQTSVRKTAPGTGTGSGFVVVSFCPAENVTVILAPSP